MPDLREILHRLREAANTLALAAHVLEQSEPDEALRVLDVMEREAAEAEVAAALLETIDAG